MSLSGGKGYGYEAANRSQSYAGRHTEEGRPKVTFSETYKNNRGTVSDKFENVRAPKTCESRSFSRRKLRDKAREKTVFTRVLLVENNTFQ